jgi:HlyD family secretion protein
MKRNLPKFTADDFLPDADELVQRPHGYTASVTVRALVLMLVLAILWATFSRTDTVVVARGKLVTSTPNIVLQASETARIEVIHVKEGQIVKRGDILVTLDPTFAMADAAQVQTKLHDLQAQEERLKEELSGQDASAGSSDMNAMQRKLALEKKANYVAQLQRMAANTARLEAMLETNTRDVSSQEARVKSLNEIEAMDERLEAQGMVAQMTVLEQRERRQDAERGLIVSRSKDAELRREIDSAHAEVAAFKSDWRERTMQELVTVSSDRDQTAELERKAERRSQLIALSAPKDGIVLEIGNRTVGSVIREAEPVLTLVPLGDELEVEVEIPSEDIGFVKVGERVMVKVDAFPFQKYGMLRGSVVTLSEDAFVNSASGLGDRMPSAYYRARIRLSDRGPGDLAKSTRLLPGMNLSAELVAGSRTVMSYILYPMMKAAKEGGREP